MNVTFTTKAAVYEQNYSNFLKIFMLYVNVIPFGQISTFFNRNTMQCNYAHYLYQQHTLEQHQLYFHHIQNKQKQTQKKTDSPFDSPA